MFCVSLQGTSGMMMGVLLVVLLVYSATMAPPHTGDTADPQNAESDRKTVASASGIAAQPSTCVYDAANSIEAKQVAIEMLCCPFDTGEPCNCEPSSLLGLDVNGDGIITKAEISAGFLRMGQQISRKQLTKIYSRLDAAGALVAPTNAPVVTVFDSTAEGFGTWDGDGSHPLLLLFSTSLTLPFLFRFPFS